MVTAWCHLKFSHGVRYAGIVLFTRCCIYYRWYSRESLRMRVCSRAKIIHHDCLVCTSTHCLQTSKERATRPSSCGVHFHGSTDAGVAGLKRARRSWMARLVSSTESRPSFFAASIPAFLPPETSHTSPAPHIPAIARWIHVFPGTLSLVLHFTALCARANRCWLLVLDKGVRSIPWVPW